MKIIQVIRHFNDGGGERFAIDLSNQLFHEGHEVVILRFHNEASLNFLQPALNAGIRVVTIPKCKGLDLRLPFKVYRFIRNEAPDVVHTHLNGFIYTILAFLFLKRFRYFHTLHNPPLIEAANKVGFYLRKILFRLKNVVPVSISDEVHSEAVTLYGMKDVPLIYNGRSVSGQSPDYARVKDFVDNMRASSAVRVIVNVARITEQKNQSLLVKTVKRLNRDSLRAKLIIIGSNHSPEIYGALQASADENIVFLERVHNVEDYLLTCDIFSLSSRWEGMPISLIEAFAAGCIPVCTPAGGVRSMIRDGENGFLADGFEEDEFTAAFERYFQTDDEKIKLISSAGLQEFQDHYSIDACAENYLKLYKERIS